jgi:putative phosphoesterase
MKSASPTDESDKPTRIGVISDTHGQVPAAAAAVLEAVSLIIHAGDLDTVEVLDQLRRIGPTLAVRGNMDRGPWAGRLPVADTIDVGGIRIHVRHILADIDLDPAAADIGLVISGHTHRFEETRKNGVVYLNPGSARLPRAGSPASMAVVTLTGSRADIRRVDL